jgi:hypothetical protein
MIYTRAQWQQKRTAAGVKSGLVKDVNMGALLDAFHNAAKGKTGNEARLAQVKTLTPLGKGLAKYKAKLAPLNKPDLMAVVDEMIKTINDSVTMGAKLANPIINIKNYVNKTITDAKAVVASGDMVAYGKLWNEDVRGVGTSLAKLALMDEGVKDIHAVWLPYTKGDWDAAGKFVTKGVTDPAAQKVRIKKAAQEILGLAIKAQSEFKARKYWL